MDGLRACCLVLVVVVSSCYGYPYLQQQIPNGEGVPHPCKPNYLWRGVGHENLRGGGINNMFGVDFKKNNLVWDATICNKDSDGDGKTNGEELGDPDCTWTPGTKPKHATGLSHPGVCEPFDSPLCSGKPDYVDCTDVEFECNAIKEPDTFNYTVRFPETPVPGEETTYECMLFEFPKLGGVEHHIVADVPYIDTEDIMHHIIVYGCQGDISSPLNQPFNCRMQADSNCTEMIGLWAVGVSGQCFHQDIGFLVGGQNGYKYGAIEMHWNNPQKRSDYVDSSGMTFYMTPKLRPNNAGTLMIGESNLRLPPGRQSFGVTGGCPGDCTPKVLNGDIKVVSTFNHMHYLGVAQLTQVLRNGSPLSNLALDRNYNYDSPVLYDHPNTVTVKPGDELRTTCVFKTTSRTTTTFWGEGTNDEMCFSFLIFYPKENTNYGTCTSWKSLSHCEITEGRTKDGCDFSKLSDFSDPKVAGVYMNISEKCEPLICREECKEFVRQLKRDNPCYRGDNLEFIRQYAKYDDNTMKLHASIDSCDLELYGVVDKDGNGVADSGTSLLCLPFTLLAMLCAIRQYI